MVELPEPNGPIDVLADMEEPPSNIGLGKVIAMEVEQNTLEADAVELKR